MTDLFYCGGTDSINSRITYIVEEEKSMMAEEQRTGGLEDKRTGGLEDKRTGGLEILFRWDEEEQSMTNLCSRAAGGSLTAAFLCLYK